MQRLIKIGIKGYLGTFEGLSKGIYLLALMMLFNRIGTLILPFLTLYVTGSLKLSISAAASATMAFGFGSLCGAYAGGILTDRLGARPTMILSLTSASAFFFVTQFATSLTSLCILLFLCSFCSDTLRPAVMSSARSYSTIATQTRALSLLRMAFNLGFAIGPAMAGLLITVFDISIIFVIDSLTCLLALAFLLKYLNNDELIVRDQTSDTQSSQGTTSPYRDGPFIALVVCFTAMLTAFFQFLYTVPLYIKNELGYDESHVGLFFGLNGLLVLILEMPLVHYVEKRYRPFAVMAGGTLLIMTGTATLLYVWPAIVGLLLYNLLISVGEIISFPFINTVAMNRASEGSVGKYMALVSMLFSVSLIISPKLGLWILDHHGYQALWISMAAICLLAAILIHYLRRSFDDVPVTP